MAFFAAHNIVLKGISSCVPKRKAYNKDLLGFSVDDKAKLIKTLGIDTRRLAAADCSASDLCMAAAEKILLDLNWRKEDIEVLVFVTQTPDYILPGSSSFIIDRLGLSRNCIGFDVNQGCAGYVYGMSLISNFMASSRLKRGLLLVGDTITKLIPDSDKSIRPLFSDAGTASAFEWSEEAGPIFFNTKTFGKSYKSIMVEDGGSKTSFHSPVPPTMQMHGMEVFQFSIGNVPPVVEELFEFSAIRKEEVDHYLFHQANQLIVNTLVSKLKIDPLKAPCSLKDFGNTNGASIPLTACLHLNGAKGRLVMCGFGVGLTVATSAIKVNELVCSELIEV